MIGMLLSVLVLLVILGLVYWAVHHLAAGFGLPPQIIVIVDVILVIIAVLALLSIFGLMPGGRSIAW